MGTIRSASYRFWHDESRPVSDSYRVETLIATRYDDVLTFSFCLWVTGEHARHRKVSGLVYTPTLVSPLVRGNATTLQRLLDKLILRDIASQTRHPPDLLTS